jgi:hypothetical protein
MLPVVLIVLAASAVLMSAFVNRGNQQVASFTLRDILSSQDCERACWLGIEPGVTSKEQVKNILENAEVNFDEVPLPDPKKNTVYDLFFPGSNDNVGALAISGETVSQITLPLDVCIARIVNEYGVPAEVQESGIY